MPASSRAVNVLPPVKVSRPGKWGNRWKIGDTVQRFSREKICETFVIIEGAQAFDRYRRGLDIKV